MPVIIPGGTTLAAESLVFDPTSEDATNTPLELISGTAEYRVLEHAYPAPPQEVQYASTVDTEGDIPASRRYRNRTITLKIDCPDYTSWLTLQAKVGKLARKGGTLRRDLPSGDVRIYDILANPSYEAQFDDKFYAGVTTVDVTLDAKPFARAEPITLSDHVETTAPALVFTETIEGDVEAYGALSVDNDQFLALQGSLRWAVQSTYYDSASTAALFVEAETLNYVTASPAVGTAGASGSGSNVIKQTALTTVFDALAYSTTFTHVGSYRVFGRFYAPAANAGTVSVRLSWSAPNAPDHVFNDSVSLPEGSWWMLDLGNVNISRGRNGTHTWSGTVEANSTSAGDDIEFDYLLLFPVDDGYGKATNNEVGTGLGNRIIVATDYVEEGDQAAGGRFSRPQGYRGDYLNLQPGVNRFLVKWSRGITDTSDPNIDDLSARLTYTPRYLT